MYVPLLFPVNGLDVSDVLEAMERQERIQGNMEATDTIDTRQVLYVLLPIGLTAGSLLYKSQLLLKIFF